MKKINIVKEKKDFDRAFKQKNQFNCKYAYVYVSENFVNLPRFGICVSKKLGNAVMRNKLKRRMKDIIDKCSLQFLNKDYIIVLKKSTVGAEYLNMKEEITKLFLNIR